MRKTRKQNFPPQMTRSPKNVPVVFYNDVSGLISVIIYQNKKLAKKISCIVSVV